MPDPVLHSVFGTTVRKRLSPEAQGALVRDPYVFALDGPDPWFGYRPWADPSRGRIMHTARTGEFLLALADQAKAGSCRGEMFSYLAGFLCHYCLDGAAHPYVIRRTDGDFPRPDGHMAFEHMLDMKQLERDGHAGERHPVTDHYFTRLQLPLTMEQDLNRVFEQVYGWKNCLRLMNRSNRVFRLFFRVMENPRGLPAFIARHVKSGGIRSWTYSNSYYQDLDVENTGHAEWKHAYDDTLVSRLGMAELTDRAADRAAGMIEAARRYVYTDQVSREELAGIIGNDSYLSGLPLDDPRNRDVGPMLPPVTDLPPRAGERP